MTCLIYGILSTDPASVKNICHWVDDNPGKLPSISYALCLLSLM